MTQRKKKKKKNDEVSEETFAAKVAGFPRWAGRSVLERAFVLYLVLLDPRVPVWAKAVVAAALAYFISPVDAVPDLLPVVGYADDGAVMAGAIAQLGTHVSEAELREARRRADDILGP